MKSRNRNSSICIIAALLAVLTVATVMGVAPHLLRPNGYAGKVTFEVTGCQFQIQGMSVLRSVAVQQGTQFDITPVRFKTLGWRGDAATTFSDYWQAFWQPTLFELRAYDADPQRACDLTNIIVAEAMKICEEEFNRREDIWLKSLSPEQYHLETLSPGCFPATGLRLWEAATLANVEPL